MQTAIPADGIYQGARADIESAPTVCGMVQKLNDKNYNCNREYLSFYNIQILNACTKQLKSFLKSVILFCNKVEIWGNAPFIKEQTMAHTVMVTGADGFIGSHLTEELVKRGEKVRAFCLYNSFGSLGWIDTLPPEIRNEIDVFMGDVRDPNGVRTAMRGQERVFHLAALIAIPFSYHSPDSYVDTNIKGTLNVLNAARELDTQRVLVTSTSEVYGTAQYVPIDEKHPFQGQSPYSATKIGADRLAESFYRSFDLPVTIVRPFNTYGPRQSGRAIIPTIITQLLAGQTEIKLGSLTPTRDFNYVKDTANGFMTIADCDAAIGQELNIATGVEHSIGDLANELIAQINPNAKIVCEAERLRPEKSEVNRLLGDSTKLRNLTGWAPQYTFEQGLAATIEFLRGNLDQYKVGQYIL